MAELLSLPDAISRHVRDGDSVAMEGFTHLIPFAAAHEVIRQERKRLTLIRMTPDLIYDQLIGMGAAEKLVFSWGGNPGVGSLHRLRDAVENGWPAALAAKRAIVTVEEVVEDFGTRSPNAAILPAWTITAIALVPGGAFPSYAHGYYKRANAFYKEWDVIARDRGTFRKW